MEGGREDHRRDRPAEVSKGTKGGGDKYQLLPLSHHMALSQNELWSELGGHDRVRPSVDPPNFVGHERKIRYLCPDGSTLSIILSSSKATGLGIGVG